MSFYRFLNTRYSLLFFFKQKTAYEILSGLVGSEMCIRDRFSGGECGGQTSLEDNKTRVAFVA